MAAACIRMCRLSVVPSFHSKALLHSAWPVAVRESLILLPNNGGNIPQLIVCRSSSFFNRLSADDLWQGVQGVSNAGKKRGRGKRGGIQKKIDLNRGQRVGEGSTNMVWPGLNAPVMKGKETVRMIQLPPDPRRQEKLIEARSKASKFRSFRVPALQRGWTGKKLPGTNVGAPDSIGDYEFTGFHTMVLEYKLVSNMTGNFGRKQRFSAFVVTGNKNGLAGYGLAKASNGKAAVKKAKNIAGQRLQYVERYQDHTIYHNFYVKEQQTAIMVKRAARGHGLICHRALKTMCEVIGIQDMYAKVEGSTGNIQNLTKAFFNGLRQQETHQELSDRMQLHVVEFRRERGNYPMVVASPKEEEVRTKGPKEEEIDLENFYFHGRVPFHRPKSRPFWEKTHKWYKKKSQLHKQRNQYSAKLDRIVMGFQPNRFEFKERLKPLKGSRE